MSGFLDVFVSWPGLFFLVGLACLYCFAAVAAAGASADERTGRDEALFLAATAAMLAVWRWPMLLWPNPLNIDEGHFTAGALKATIDFAPWRGFDTVTSGPLNVYILTLPALFGLAITLFSSRVIALLLVFATLCALFYGLKWTLGNRVAHIGLVPPAVFFTLTTDPEFVHCSTEHFPIFLSTVALAATAYLTSGASPIARIAAAALSGVAAGAAVFAKLQVTPLAALAFVLTVITLCATRKRPGSRLQREAAVAFAAVCLVPAMIITSLVLTDTCKEAWISYVGSSLDFILRGKPVGWQFFFLSSPWFGTLLTCSLLMLAVAAGAAFATRKRPPAGVLIVSAILLAVAFIVIWQPQRPWRHYLLFAVVPLSCCVAVAIAALREASWWKRHERAAVAGYIAFFILPVLSIVIAIPHPFLKSNPAVVARPQLQAIARHTAPGDRLAVWGWMPHYYVETQTIPATREAETIRQIEPGPYRDFFRRRFLSDLKATMPAAFVDAVASSTWYFNDRNTQGIESFPDLHNFISAHYELKEEIDGVRIFVRKRS